MNKRIDVYNKFAYHKSTLTIEDFIESTKTGEFLGEDFTPLIEEIRATDSKERRDGFKKRLPAVTTGGTFKDGKRKKEYVDQYSNIVVIDIDKIGGEAVEAIKKKRVVKDNLNFITDPPVPIYMGPI